MEELERESRDFKRLVVRLILLPSKNLSPTDFEKEEEKLFSEIEGLVLDPYWSDYVFFPDEHGLRDCMTETESGEISIDEGALEAVVEKVFSYQPIIV